MRAFIVGIIIALLLVIFVVPSIAIIVDQLTQHSLDHALAQLNTHIN